MPSQTFASDRKRWPPGTQRSVAKDSSWPTSVLARCWTWLLATTGKLVLPNRRSMPYAAEDRRQYDRPKEAVQHHHPDGDVSAARPIENQPAWNCQPGSEGRNNCRLEMIECCPGRSVLEAQTQRHGKRPPPEHGADCHVQKPKPNQDPAGRVHGPGLRKERGSHEVTMPRSSVLQIAFGHVGQPQSCRWPMTGCGRYLRLQPSDFNSTLPPFSTTANAGPEKLTLVFAQPGL